jgi:2,3-dihydroxy-p-cumate/2,3-dihydroxybenzoate 3,4-dioxygenase
MALPFRQSLTKIVRLGHVVLSVERFDEMTDFLTTQLGFAVSDFVEGRFAFLRCQPNPLHHSFAIGRSAAGNHLNHVNFMVSDMDDIGIAMNRLQKHEVPIVFGPGRHQPSGSIFLYFLDPDGMSLEYSFGMEEFPEKGAREARMLEAHPLALDTWGSVPQPAFGKVGAIEPKVRT